MSQLIIRNRPDTGTLPVWNALVPVVMLIRADSAETAVAVLAEALDRSGFEVMEDPDGVYRTGAFESEPATPYPLPGLEMPGESPREYYTEQEAGQ